MSLEEKNQKLGIFGLSRTGIALYKALQNQAKLTLYDDSYSNLKKFLKTYPNENIKDLSHSTWQELNKIFISPGIPLEHPIFKFAKQYGIEISSDIDLLYEKNPDSNFFCITGTNGKSTTTALIGHILKNANFNCAIGGNIGIPALSLPKAKNYVLELSSFQLNLMNKLSASIAVMLNITPDHLDRHSNMENYIKAKEKIFANLSSNTTAVIGIDNLITAEIFKKYYNLNKFKVIPISIFKNLNNGVSIIKDYIYDNIYEFFKLKLPKNKYIPGLHNCENIAASYTTCRLIGVKPEIIIESIETFKGLPHRIEYVGSLKNIIFYNDSKATNAEAASKSLASFRNIYWLVGGVGKDGGISSLKPLFKKITKAYLFGQDKTIFAKQLEGWVNFTICNNLKEAFEKAYDDARLDTNFEKVILLAPAAASYDQFKDYEERGKYFINLYKTLLV